MLPPDGALIVDLGCAPGSWSQWLLKMKKGYKVTGFDILPVKLNGIAGFSFIKASFADFNELDALEAKLSGSKFGLVISDAAPNITGTAFEDHMQSLSLAAWSAVYSFKLGQKGSAWVAKVFPGEDLERFRSIIKPGFKKLQVFVPKSVRKSSKEVYFVGKGLKPDIAADLVADIEQFLL